MLSSTTYQTNLVGFVVDEAHFDQSLVSFNLCLHSVVDT